MSERLPRNLHTKHLGSMGEAKVMLELYKVGARVFIEHGDISRIDLIAERDGKLVRLQVKAAHRRLGVYSLDSRKKAKGYEYVYGTDDVDFFALYAINDDAVLWIRASDALKESQRRIVSFRFAATKNNQKARVRFANDYTDPTVIFN